MTEMEPPKLASSRQAERNWNWNLSFGVDHRR
jgi:hypothetical protein